MHGMGLPETAFKERGSFRLNFRNPVFRNLKNPFLKPYQISDVQCW
jgi:hypothetical protein